MPNFWLRSTPTPSPSLAGRGILRAMHRLFVAIRPPEAVRDLLLDTMEVFGGLRWQEDEQLHLTLRFVGEVERPLAEDLAAALATLRFAPFPDPHRRGRALRPPQARRAVGGGRTARAPRRARRQGRADLRWRWPAPRTPRVPPARHACPLAPRRGRFPRPVPLRARRAAQRAVAVDTITLYESRLGRDGAHYEAVAEGLPPTAVDRGLRHLDNQVEPRRYKATYR